MEVERPRAGAFQSIFICSIMFYVAYTLLFKVPSFVNIILGCIFAFGGIYFIANFWQYYNEVNQSE